MAKWKPWLKLWVEWIHDPKMFSLTWAEKGMWCGLITLAQQCAAGGQLVKGDGTPLTIPEIANSLHITSAKDRKILEGMISKMAGAGSLHWNSNLLVVTHFAERQEKTASQAAISERVEGYRERQKALAQVPAATMALAEEIRTRLRDLPRFDSYLQEHEAMKESLAALAKLKGFIPVQELTVSSGRVDLCWTNESGDIISAFEVDAFYPKYKSIVKLRELGRPSFIILRRNPTHIQLEQDVLLIGLGRPKIKDEPPDTTPPHLEEEEEEELEAEAERNAKKRVTRNGKTVTFEPALAEITKLYEQHFGIISPFFAEKIKDFCENYRGPVEWIDLAFAEAVKYKNRRWQYVEKILYTWQEKGGPHADRGQRQPPGRGAGAHGQDIEKGDRFSGFRAIESGPDEPESGDEG